MLWRVFGRKDPFPLMRIRSLACAALVAAFLVAGCGPSERPSPFPAATPWAVAEVRDLVSPTVVRLDVKQEVYADGKRRLTQGIGSGVIIDAEGRILTNFHVAGRAAEIHITLFNKERVKATLIGEDHWTDLAIVQLDMDEVRRKNISFAHAQLGDSSTLQVGQDVMAIGTPFGLARTVTLGVVSNADRTFYVAGTEQTRIGEYETGNFNNWIQMDTPINPGNSGGPLVDMTGKVVGINTRGGGQNLNFAIPINIAKEVAAKLMADSTPTRRGRVARSDLGIQLKPLQGFDEDFSADDLNKGVLVNGVERFSPALAAGVQARDSFVTPLDNGTMNFFRTPAAAAPYTLNKQGSGTLNLQGANTYTGGTQVNAGDLVLSGGGTANQVVPQNEVQQLKLFGSNRVGQTQSITGGTFTLSLTMPGGNTVTTGAITYNTNPATLATNIANAINAALASFNVSTNAANVPSVTVAPAAGITNTSNPLVFNITFSGAGQQFINQPKITTNVTNALTGAVGADIVTTVHGTGREVQTLSFAGTPGSLISFQFGGQTRSYWDETQRITVPGTFQNGDTFFLTVFGVRLPIIYDNTSTANLVANIQGVLDQAFGENIFAVTAPNVTTIDISPGTATDTLGLTPDFGAAGRTGPVLRTANLPNIQANFPVAELQTITFPAQFVTGSTYRISFLGLQSPIFTFDAADPLVNINNIVTFLDSFEGFAGNYLLQSVAGNVRQYTIRYQDRFAGVFIPNTPPGLSFIAVNPTNAITVANTVIPPATLA